MEIVQPAQFFVYGEGQITPHNGIVYLDGELVGSAGATLRGDVYFVCVHAKAGYGILALLSCSGVVSVSTQLYEIAALLEQGRYLVFVCSRVQRLLLQCYFRSLGNHVFSSNFRTPISFLDSGMQNEDIYLYQCISPDYIVIRLEGPPLDVKDFPIIEAQQLISVEESQCDAVLAAFRLTFLSLEQRQICIADDIDRPVECSLGNVVIYSSGYILECLQYIDITRRLKALQTLISESWCELWDNGQFVGESYCCGMLLLNSQWYLAFLGPMAQGITSIRIVQAQ